jgi:hypothetical protein
MPSFSRNDVVLVAYPFSDCIGVKVRPAVVVSGPVRWGRWTQAESTSRFDRGSLCNRWKKVTVTFFG